MKNATLEQKAERTKTENLQGATRTIKCPNDLKRLQVPNCSLKPNTEYGDFYVSPCGVIYCSKSCYDTDSW